MVDTTNNFIGSRDDLVNVMKMMAALRDKTLAVKNITDEQKDEYLSLVNVLSTGISRSQQPIVRQKREKIEKMLDGENGVAAYDPMQDEYWRERNPKLTQNLDDLLIALQGEHFTRIDDKHHVLQAIRFLRAEKLKGTEKTNVKLSISPYNDKIEVPEESIFKKTLSMFLGATYIVETSKNDKTALRVFGDPENIDYAMKEAAKLGYNTIEAIVESSAGRKLQGVINGSKVMSNYLSVSDLPSALQGTLSRLARGITEKGLKEDYCLIRIPLTSPREAPAQDNRAIEYMKAIAETLVPRDIEENLVVGTGNFNSFGKKFISFVDAEAIKKKVPKPEIEPILDRENQMVVYHTESRVDRYSKFTTLLCSKDRRYILTTISDKIPEDYLPNLTKIMINGQNPESKVAEIADRFGVKFVNLTKYDQDQQPETYEGLR